jgi:UDP-N-acetylmuramate dehydrogenase
VNLQQNVPLAPLTTLGVGGPARWFVEARSAQEVFDAVNQARELGTQLFVLGGGSNLVVSDEGWPGLVLKIAIEGIDERRENGTQLFEAGAGVEWDAFVAHTVRRNCPGIECLSGIPGTVGGTPVQNVGAYGQEVSQTIHSVQALDLNGGTIFDFCNEACEFTYRSSIFNTYARGRFIILRVTFALEPDGEPRLEYADLKHYFASRKISAPTLQETRDAVREIRRQKGMLIVEGDEDCSSAGSFFKNPVVTAPRFVELSALALQRGFTMPSFETAQGIKVPAAWLVEHSGFYKGYMRGPVGISRKHALAIVNRGGAKAADVVALKDDIQQRVRDEWNVELQPEPVFLGFGAIDSAEAAISADSG